MTDATPTPDEVVVETRNRAERRRADREQRRAEGSGRRGRFKYTAVKAMVDEIKANLKQWEQTREFHELNVDKNEALIDALDPATDDFEERVTVLEDAISEEERQIAEYDVAITNAETRIQELQAR